jgi:hypothetical protein
MVKMVNISIKMDKPDDKPGDAERRAQIASHLFTAIEGTTIETVGPEIKIAGDLGKMMGSALADADAMFNNEGEKIKVKYAAAIAMFTEAEQKDSEKKMFRQWHNVLTKMDKAFKKEKMVPEAKICSDVMKKTIEAAYNFYGIQTQKVSEKAGLMTFVLVFYVAYTMWWGFAIFFIFEGIGLSMKKAKVKKEV